VMAMFMAIMDITIVNVALPQLARDFGVSPDHIDLVVVSFLVSLAVFIPASGWLGDRFGMKRVLLSALVIFTVASALCGLSQSLAQLVIFRALQGVGGGMLTPVGMAMLFRTFPPAERVRASRILIVPTAFAPALGPVVGGLLVTDVSWRWVFYVNVPIGLVALVLAARLVPATTGGRSRAHLDLVGSLLLGGGVLAILLPLVQADGGGLRRWSPLFGAAAVLLAAFVRWEQRTVGRGRAPLLDPRLTRTPGYLAGSTVGLVYFAGFTGLWLVLALFLQDGLGYSPLRSGLAVTPFACGMAASAVIAGRLVPRLGRWLTVIGLSTVILGLVTTALVLRYVGGDAAAWATAGPLLFAGLGGGLVTSPNITLTLQNVPVRMAGAAGGGLQTAQRLGSAVGTAVLTVIFYRVLTATGRDYHRAISDTLLVACAFMALGLLVAVVELIRRSAGRGGVPGPREKGV
jgi:EmrB/QacA subfamily drug resistance transporter